MNSSSVSQVPLLVTSYGADARRDCLGDVAPYWVTSVQVTFSSHTHGTKAFRKSAMTLSRTRGERPCNLRGAICFRNTGMRSRLAPMGPATLEALASRLQ
jgi:hypothetical protein